MAARSIPTLLRLADRRVRQWPSELCAYALRWRRPNPSNHLPSSAAGLCCLFRSREIRPRTAQDQDSAAKLQCPWRHLNWSEGMILQTSSSVQRTRLLIGPAWGQTTDQRHRRRTSATPQTEDVRLWPLKPRLGPLYRSIFVRPYSIKPTARRRLPAQGRQAELNIDICTASSGGSCP